ncbi:HpcH/HpaI aldolase/citrate lyase family protein [Zwartia vadi]|uniref:HpcH/HpaI aldolase/citrate lyase family protein n=1 Tax=Zwartia vadi TaxID=3058168 RepID=UPI0025B2D26D|nr:CoA ester lyase [Zwartia vadi]MDN3988271.1 CoA ester lyase [Zwartia vadi]
MRSKLFVPGSRPELFDKALASEADGLSFDLEDAVAESKKADARETLSAWLDTEHARNSNKTIIVRVNAMETPYFEQDIAQVVRAGLDMVNLPKPDSPEAVRQAIGLIEQAERANGVNQDGMRPIKLLLNIETPKALRTAYELACAHTRVAGLQLGLGDLFEPISVSRKEPFAVKFSMMQVKFAAAEAGIDAFDGAFADIKNTEGFMEEARFAARLGYVGKSCIHPSQVAMSNEAFRPSDEAIAHALRILEAAKDAQARGVGAYVVDGKMIDPPFYNSAVALIDKAKRLGLI